MRAPFRLLFPCANCWYVGPKRPGSLADYKHGDVMRIGVFGGSFDPVHNGHLRVAEACGQSVSLDTVLLVPAAAQPLKPHGPVAPADDRVKMLKLAVRGRDELEVSTLETERGGVSYTADTLMQLAERRLGDSLFLILGADALRDFPNWHQPDIICNLATLVVVDRPGAPRIEAARIGGKAASTPRVIQVSMDPIDISSTEIRRRIARDESIEHLVPQPVAAYIRRTHLYK